MNQAVNNGTWTGKGMTGGPMIGDQFDYNKEMQERESSDLYLEIRNLMMMLIIPKRIHKKDSKQGAYLKASIVRVSLVIIYIVLYNIT